MTANDTLPPHDEALERALVGSAMVGGTLNVDLDPGDLFIERHRLVLEAARAVASTGAAVDPVLVGAHLKEAGRLEQIGGPGYLTELINSVPVYAPKQIAEYTRRIRELSKRRRILVRAQLIETELRHDVGDFDEWCARARDAFAEVCVVGGDEATWARHLVAAPLQWFTTPPATRTWLLRDGRRADTPGLLPLGKAGMLISEGGGGKTQLLCQLAIAVATGTDFLGTFPVASPGRVLLVVGEEDAEEMHRRLYNASRTGTPTPPEGSIVVLPLAGIPCAMLESDERGNPQESAFARWLFAYLAGKSFALTVLDPLSRFAGLEAEVDNAQATRFVQVVERISTLTGGTTLASHHTAKPYRNGAEVSASAARGSSTFVDGFRWVASLGVTNVAKSLETPEERDRLGEVVSLSFVKSNYSRKGDPIQLRRDERGGLVPLDEIDRETVARVTSGAADREAKAHARLDARDAVQVSRVERDAAAVRAYVQAHPGCSVRDARAYTVSNKSDRWAAAVLALGR